MWEKLNPTLDDLVLVVFVLDPHLVNGDYWTELSGGQEVCLDSLRTSAHAGGIFTLQLLVSDNLSIIDPLTHISQTVTWSNLAASIQRPTNLFASLKEIITYTQTIAQEWEAQDLIHSIKTKYVFVLSDQFLTKVADTKTLQTLSSTISQMQEREQANFFYFGVGQREVHQSISTQLNILKAPETRADDTGQDLSDQLSQSKDSVFIIDTERLNSEEFQRQASVVWSKCLRWLMSYHISSDSGTVARQIGS